MQPTPAEAQGVGNPPGSGEDMARAQFDLLRANMPFLLLGNVVIGGILVWGLWDGEQSASLATWGAAVLLLSLLRALVEWGPERLHMARLPVFWQDVYYVASSGLSGVLWGSPALLFIDYSDPVGTAFVTLVLAGMIAGGMTSLSTRVATYWAYAIPIMLPLSIMMWITDTIPAGGALTLAYLLVNLAFSRVLQRSHTSNIQQRFHNLELVQQLSQQKQVAEQANLAKSRFLAAASHDLRQPLTALELFLSALDGTLESDEQRRLMQRVQQSSTSLQELLDALLDISRLDAQSIEPNVEPIPVVSLFAGLADEFAPLAAEKGLSFDTKVCDCAIASDPLLLRRMLSNLLSNAIRYTEKGGVHMACVPLPDGGVSLEVQDTGIGIAGAEQQQVFDEFHQLNNPSRDRAQGLGLGLAIVRRLSQLLDHPLSLESEPGEGSRFAIRVPLGEMPQALAQPAHGSEPVEWRGRVLVLDDEIDVREALQATLQRWRMPARSVADVEQALRLLDSGEFEPELLICDYRLSGGRSGIDAVRDMRKAIAREVPALIISGDTGPDQVALIHNSGLTWLSKPVGAETLFQRIQQLMRAAP